MANVTRIPSTRQPISQERLQTLRDLGHKLAELRLLEGNLAAELLAEIDAGAPVEAGRWGLRVQVRQGGMLQRRRVVIE